MALIAGANLLPSLFILSEQFLACTGAAPTALRFLTALSEVASGRREPEREDPFGDYALALRLSGQDPVGHDGPSFALEI